MLRWDQDLDLNLKVKNYVVLLTFIVKQKDMNLKKHRPFVADSRELVPLFVVQFY